LFSIRIYKKDLSQFFGNMTGYMVIALFSLVLGLMLFVLDDFNILHQGYADLNTFFDLAPWTMVFLSSAISMRTFTDEYRLGTMDLLKTLPITRTQLVFSKFLFVLTTIVLALVPSFIYVLTISFYSATGQIDTGALIGSYIGLLLLSACFAAIGIFFSSLSQNMVASFFLSVMACLLLYYGFNSLSRLPFFSGGLDYYLDMAGIDFHYRNMSRGVLDSRDVVYCFSLIFLFLYYTRKKLADA
jgi:ABC-2 type transport system permease protein